MPRKKKVELPPIVTDPLETAKVAQLRYVSDERPEPQPATVNVRGQGAADRQVVGAGLLLNDSPLARLPGTGPEQVVHQTRPIDARFDGGQTALAIEIDDARERRQVEKNGIRAELLAAHRVPSAGDGDAAPLGRRAPHGALERVHGVDGEDLPHGRAIQVRVHIVDRDRQVGASRVGGCRLRANHHARHFRRVPAEKS